MTLVFVLSLWRKCDTEIDHMRETVLLQVVFVFTL